MQHKPHSRQCRLHSPVPSVAMAAYLREPLAPESTYYYSPRAPFLYYNITRISTFSLQCRMPKKTMFEVKITAQLQQVEEYVTHDSAVTTGIF